MVRRIAIKGTSGAGKSTLSRQLSQRLGVPYVELDALHHGPSWTEASAEELRARLSAALDDERGWVVDGNYDHKLGTMVLERAQLVVWLDLPLRLKLWRLGKRTLKRVLTREVLWNGNRETWESVLEWREGLFAWTLRTHFQQRREWPHGLGKVQVVRLRSIPEVEDWLQRIA